MAESELIIGAPIGRLHRSYSSHALPPRETYAYAYREYFHLGDSAARLPARALSAISRSFADTGALPERLMEPAEFGELTFMRARAGRCVLFLALLDEGIPTRNCSASLMPVRKRNDIALRHARKMQRSRWGKMRFETRRVSQVSIELQGHRSCNSRPPRYGSDLTPVDLTARPGRRRDITRASALFPCSLKYAAYARTAVLPTKARFTRSIFGDHISVNRDAGSFASGRSMGN